MNDLYIEQQDVFHGEPLSQYSLVKASRSDVLEALGWEVCGECSGSNCKWDGDHEGRDCEPCGHCVEGYEPPASQVEAAAPYTSPFYGADDESIELARKQARAALIAAMEGVGDD